MQGWDTSRAFAVATSGWSSIFLARIYLRGNQWLILKERLTEHFKKTGVFYF
jgi:hypothetical protein